MRLRVHTFYRLSLALPIVVPFALIAFVNLTGWRPHGRIGGLLQFLAYSGVIGLIPYGIVALWGAFWVRERPEREIHRRAVLAPLFTMAAISPYIVIA
jgi:ABC-type sugar transport system permease subunit